MDNKIMAELAAGLRKKGLNIYDFTASELNELEDEFYNCGEDADEAITDFIDCDLEPWDERIIKAKSSRIKDYILCADCKPRRGYTQDDIGSIMQAACMPSHEERINADDGDAGDPVMVMKCPKCGKWNSEYFFYVSEEKL